MNNISMNYIGYNYINKHTNEIIQRLYPIKQLNIYT